MSNSANGLPLTLHMPILPVVAQVVATSELLATIIGSMEWDDLLNASLVSRSQWRMAVPHIWYNVVGLQVIVGFMTGHWRSPNQSGTHGDVEGDEDKGPQAIDPTALSRFRLISPFVKCFTAEKWPGKLLKISYDFLRELIIENDHTPLLPRLKWLSSCGNALEPYTRFKSWAAPVSTRYALDVLHVFIGRQLRTLVFGSHNSILDLQRLRQNAPRLVDLRIYLQSAELSGMFFPVEEIPEEEENEPEGIVWGGLQGPYRPHDVVAELQNWTSLTHLTVTCLMINAASAQGFGRLSSLRSLIIFAATNDLGWGGVQFEDGAFPSLQELSFLHIPPEKLLHIMQPAVLSGLTRFTWYNRLYRDRTSMDMCINALGEHAQKLRVLHLGAYGAHCLPVFSEGRENLFANLTRCPLEEIRFHRVIGPSNLEHLLKNAWPRLRNLEMPECELSLACLPLFAASHPLLSFLDVRLTGMEELSRVDITGPHTDVCHRAVTLSFGIWDELKACDVNPFAKYLWSIWPGVVPLIRAIGRG